MNSHHNSKNQDREKNQKIKPRPIKICKVIPWHENGKCSREFSNDKCAGSNIEQRTKSSYTERKTYICWNEIEAIILPFPFLWEHCRISRIWGYHSRELFFFYMLSEICLAVVSHREKEIKNSNLFCLSLLSSGVHAAKPTLGAYISVMLNSVKNKELVVNALTTISRHFQACLSILYQYICRWIKN